MLVLFAGTAIGGQGIPRKLVATDDAGKDPSLKVVRDRMRAAARAHDLNGVMRDVAADISLSYLNERRGVDELKKEWKIETHPAKFLDELATMLSLGGHFDAARPDTFIAPSFFLDYPDVTSMGSHGVVIHPNAPVYQRPEATSHVVATVTADVLPMLVAFKGWVRGWVQVTLPDGRLGYMQLTDLRSPSDTRAYFGKTGDGWKLTALFGGID
jgi:hypothetical protein